MGRAKGTALVVLVETLRAQHENALKILPESLRRYLDQPVTSAAWYPEEDLVGLARAIVRLSSGPAEEILAQIGQETARRQKQGVYANLMDRISRLDTRALWATQHDSGKMDVFAEGSAGARIELSDYESSREVCGLLRGFIEETLRLAGFRDPVTRKVSCRAEGDDKCVWRNSWKPSDRGRAEG